MPSKLPAAAPIPIPLSFTKEYEKTHMGHKDINAYVVIYFKTESEKLTLV